ncbi:hypothetical protein M409DRAFT_28732 [Zasmidium cellare ATCC 36951]|uniref:Uncharacterized protein n=1 Tax=Zasmidium cellare ATCC 36951 TaxID=1080233 RepID=A0A6A6C4R3_ZASCE|nr:uncharacterized protein M409DRAFT_28732 [Zasmidium cellare ATCC 36951]KAF2160852.1 hypothetical protein M409DRAFT_28732 [Zasmidium cellare ATCC 36951]
MASNEHQHQSVDDGPGPMYKEKWVQDLIQQLKDFVGANHSWLGLDVDKKQRVLDYACGNGTISEGLALVCPKTSFHGIDILSAQVTRYNTAAANLLGDDANRMVAIEGDLFNPSTTLEGPEWYGFDMAITSMALHHFTHPVDMLRLLAQRIKPGGTVVVADWLKDVPLPPRESAGEGGEKRKRKKPYHPVQNADPEEMEDIHGTKIWMGFTEESIKESMEIAGLKECEVRLHPELSKMPENLGGDQQIFYAKGVVS